jgi:rhodanese-related sulfurtransferase
MKMTLVLTGIGLAILCVLIAIRIKHMQEKRRLQEHSITPEDLHAALNANPKVLLYDVRQPLDLLAYSETIPGAIRIAPKELFENPNLIPKDENSIVYCTCPNDETSRVILDRALSMNFFRVKFLKGGLAAWKAKGYPVEPYKESFHLDSST